MQTFIIEYNLFMKSLIKIFKKINALKLRRFNEFVIVLTQQCGFFTR